MPFQNHLNILLNDVQKELLVLQSQRPEAERRGVTTSYVPVSAMNVMKSALGCFECRAA